MAKMKLNEVYSDWLTGDGIFTDLQTLEVPWAEEGIAEFLNLSYYGNHSGQKEISPLLRAFGELNSTKRAKIASLIFNLYAPYWTKEYETLSLEYNPIENYNMLEFGTDKNETTYGRKDKRTDDLTQERTPDLTHERTADLTHERTDDLTETLTPRSKTNTHSEVTNKIHGFNSTTGVDADETITDTDVEGKTGTDTTTNTGTETTTETGTDTTTETGTDTTTNTGTVENEASGKDTTDITHGLTRTGNIGVTTSQQMLESERQLWMWNFFENVVFKDIDKQLTLSVY